MSEQDETKYLEQFPQWLRELGQDAGALGELLGSEAAIAQSAKELLVGGLNYLFKSMDLIPDGLDDIGYLDDAFVLRIAAALAKSEDGSLGGRVDALSQDSEEVRAFLGDDYARLEAYVVGLRAGSARGRAVEEIVGDAETYSAFLGDVQGFAKSYEAPSFEQAPKNLIKLRAFFDAKLPR